MAETTIRLGSIIDPDGSIVYMAETVADTVLKEISLGNGVTVALEGVRGVTSSFFNVILKRVFDAHGPQAMRDLRFSFDNDAQKAVFSRSVAAVLQSGKIPQ